MKEAMKSLGLPGLHLLRASQKGRYTSILTQHQDRLTFVPRVPGFNPAVKVTEVNHTGVLGLMSVTFQNVTASPNQRAEIEAGFVSRGFKKQEQQTTSRSQFRKPIRVFYLSREWSQGSVDGLLLAGSESRDGSVDVEAVFFSREKSLSQLFFRERLVEDQKNMEAPAEDSLYQKELNRCSFGFARSVMMCAWCLGGYGKNLFNIPTGTEQQYYEMCSQNASLYANRASRGGNSGLLVSSSFAPYEIKKLEVSDPIIIRAKRHLAEATNKQSTKRESTFRGLLSQELIAFMSSKEYRHSLSTTEETAATTDTIATEAIATDTISTETTETIATTETAETTTDEKQ